MGLLDFRLYLYNTYGTVKEFHGSFFEVVLFVKNLDTQPLSPRLQSYHETNPFIVGTHIITPYSYTFVK